MLNIIFRVERWKWNKEYKTWVSTEGRFKDENKHLISPGVKSNYLRLHRNGKNVYAHRLVMITWRPIKNYEGMSVDHVNHNTRDNSLSNLEWITIEENQEKAKIDNFHIDAEIAELKAKKDKKSCVSALTYTGKTPRLRNNVWYPCVFYCKSNNNDASQIIPFNKREDFLEFVSKHNPKLNEHHAMELYKQALGGDAKALQKLTGKEPLLKYRLTVTSAYKPPSMIAVEVNRKIGRIK